jgi:hypothetical protein
LCHFLIGYPKRSQGCAPRPKKLPSGPERGFG